MMMALSGIALGLGATALVLDRKLGIGAVHAGVWRIWPKAGTPEIDPYSQARLSRSGEIPIGLTVGLALTAAVDAQGEPLHANCDYAISGRIPLSRYWTLTWNDPDGWLTGPTGLRHNLTSAEILQRADGMFDIKVSRQARPGNWLPVAGNSDFMLVLRLYDTGVSATASAIEADTLPELLRGACS